MMSNFTIFSMTEFYRLLPVFFLPSKGRSECEPPAPVPMRVWAGPAVASIKAAPNKRPLFEKGLDIIIPQNNIISI